MTTNYIEAIRSNIDLATLLHLDGIKFSEDGSACPFCKAVAAFHVDSKAGIYSCFNCKEGGDLFAYIMKTDGVPFEAACEILREIIANRYRKMFYLLQAFMWRPSMIKQEVQEVIDDAKLFRRKADPVLLELTKNLLTFPSMVDSKENMTAFCKRMIAADRKRFAEYDEETLKQYGWVGKTYEQAVFGE